MSNAVKLTQKLIFVISLPLCLSYPDVFSPLYAESEPLLLLLCGGAALVAASAIKRASSRNEARGKGARSG
jgi:hypothetical protein